MINLTFTGTADEIRADMARLLSAPQITIASPVYDVSVDTPKAAADTDGEPAGTQAPPPTKRRGRPTKLPEGPALNVVANISTGDERVEPKAGVDFAKIAEEMDEAPVEEAKTYTIDDVRNAATPYIKKHTMAAAQADLQDCLEAAVGVRKISELDPTDQGKLKKAVEAFEAAGKAEARFVKAA